MTAIQIIREFEAKFVSEWTYEGIRDVLAAFNDRPRAERQLAMRELGYAGRLTRPAMNVTIQARWLNRLGSYQRCQTIFSQP